MNKKAQIGAIFFTLVVFFVIVAGIFFHIVGLPIEDSRGEHTGYITAVETNGLIWKTDSVYIKSELSSSQEDRYCIIDEKITETLKQKAISGEKVTLVFNDWFSRGIKNCKTSDIAIVIGVK